MPSYNINAIRDKLDKFTKRTPATKGNNKEYTKLTFFKPDVGEYDIRFINVAQTEEEAPIFEVLYYKNIAADRFVAPRTFGLPDPIDEVRQSLIKEKDPAKRKLFKFVIPQERYYAVIINRKEEEKGPLVWEISQELCKDIYAILMHKDYVDEDLFDAEKGYDFTLTVTPKLEQNGKPRTYNGSIVKSFSLQPRRKSSKLAAKAEQAKKWLEAVPDLKSYFKAQVKSPEQIVELLNAFQLKFEAGEIGNNTPTPTGTTKINTKETSVAEAEKSVDDAFKDLEEPSA